MVAAYFLGSSQITLSLTMVCSCFDVELWQDYTVLIWSGTCTISCRNYDLWWLQYETLSYHCPLHSCFRSPRGNNQQKVCPLLRQLCSRIELVSTADHKTIISSKMIGKSTEFRLLLRLSQLQKRETSSRGTPSSRQQGRLVAPCARYRS